MNTTTPTKALVLAAGKGTRMKSELPKVATLLQGKPLLVHVVESLKKSGIDEIYIVVGYKKEIVRDLVKGFGSIFFIEQKEQLGTGHAVLCAEPELHSFQGKLLVCCGDVPAISSNSFRKLQDFHIQEANAVTVLSAKITQPKGYGRMIRDKQGVLESIVEEKDASEVQKSIQEVNTGTYIFDSPSVFTNLKAIGRENAQNEYYLPDLVKVYRNQNSKTGAMLLDNPLESMGVNSPDDLSNLENLIQEGKLIQ